MFFRSDTGVHCWQCIAMTFLLAVADAHVPTVKDEIPERLRRLIKPGKISTVLCLGNCGRSVINVIKMASNDIRRVAGEEDTSSTLPDTLTFEMEGVRVGLCHGHLVVPRGDTLALDALRRRLDVDVLFSAATGAASVTATQSGLLINPGSVTGASLSLVGDAVPSYIVVSIEAGRVMCWVYQLQGPDDLQVDRHEWYKPGSQEQTGGAGGALRGASAMSSLQSTALTDASEASGKGAPVLDTGRDAADADDGDSATPSAGGGNAAPLELPRQKSGDGGETNAPAALDETDFGAERASDGDPSSAAGGVGAPGEDDMADVDLGAESAAEDLRRVSLEA